MNLNPYTFKSFKLDTNAPTFGGKDNKLNIEDWIFTMENCLILGGIPPELKILAVTPYLRGVAFQIAKKHQMENKDHMKNDQSWTDLKEELKEVFTPVDQERKFRTE